ncbi:MAG: peptidoglycan DD-metalloendopeptidase family protein [Legionellaceae bacterium]|nr:peptidoglycan DD-metalloendopeptidase family protein [Legionellaceae bacterium]
MKALSILMLKRLASYQKILICSAISLLVLGSCWIIKTYTHTNQTADEMYQTQCTSDEAVIPPKDPQDPDEALWQDITAQPGDSLALIFKRMDLSPATLHAVMDNNPEAHALTHLQPNQHLKFLIHDHQLEQLILSLSPTRTLTVRRDENDNTYTTKTHHHKTSIKIQSATGLVHHSLYTTAKQYHIPYTLIRQMTDILGWEINFARDIREGDQFTLIYEAHYIDNELTHTGDVLAVSYTSQGHTHQAIQHKSPEFGVGYFTPQGTSVRKAFSRYPLQFSHISSMFNLSRMHPVLKQRRPHKGVDLAAPIGTPIRATSNGRVISIGYENGYGNKIKLQHPGNYTSIYGHMLKFKKGLTRGAQVKRGDIIGYVGQTGMATGPHCHYELRLNDKPLNPSTVKLPQAFSVPTKELAQFKMHAATQLAQLQRYEAANIAQLETPADTQKIS